MPSKIEAQERNLNSVFNDEFSFRIPRYQRPYAWGADQAGELLDDIIEAMSRDPESPYFLGSIVLIKNEHESNSDVVDGQQRLTTLTMLLCILRDLAEEPQKSDLDAFIREKGSFFRKTSDRFRLSLRVQDQRFFNDNVQKQDATPDFLQSDTAAFSDSQKQIAGNVKHLHGVLKDLDNERRDKLGIFIIQQCYLVVVTTTDRDSAYRIFSVMNDRGLDLSPTDILKADTIGDLSESAQESYGQKWENIEERIGRDDFRDLFAHIRMISLKTKLRSTLQADFQDHILKDADGADFIDNTLEPYANAFEVVTQASYVSTSGADKVNEYSRYLGHLDNFDWTPPAMAFFHCNPEDTEALTKFTKDLERLAYGLFIKRANVNERILRYADVLRSVENDDDLFDVESPLQLKESEKQDILKSLDGDIYLQTPVFRRILLERLDRLLDDNHYDFTKSSPTVEHVLPQNPSQNSEWAAWNDADRATWTHRLANLVLLSRRKNSSASNWDFQRKKTEYFQGKTVTTYALTTQVLNEDEWTIAVLERRQTNLLGSLKQEWRLG